VFKKGLMRIKQRNYANRGKVFEKRIIESNEQYAWKCWASIIKTEAPFKKIGRYRQYAYGFYESKGFVDFVGICNGRSLCFEAKSTKERTSFPLRNIHDYQYKSLEHWYKQGSISFVIVEFEKRHMIYILKFPQLKKWWEEAEQGGRKSIPFEWFHFNCQRVRTDRGVTLDYLQALNLP